MYAKQDAPALPYRYEKFRRVPPPQKPAWFHHFSTFETGHELSCSDRRSFSVCSQALPDHPQDLPPPHNGAFMSFLSPHGVPHDYHHSHRSTAMRRALRFVNSAPGALAHEQHRPKFPRLPGKVIYRPCDIEAYENEGLFSSTADLRKPTTKSTLEAGLATTDNRL